MRKKQKNLFFLRLSTREVRISISPPPLIFLSICRTDSLLTSNHVSVRFGTAVIIIIILIIMIFIVSKQKEKKKDLVSVSFNENK